MTAKNPLTHLFLHLLKTIPDITDYL